MFRGTATGQEGSTPIATDVMAPHFTDTNLVRGVTYYYQDFRLASIGFDLRMS